MNDNPEVVKEKIEFLKNLDLCKLTWDEIKQHFLSTSLTVPYHIWLQHTGAKIFRGQISEEKPLVNISRLSYNPNPATKIGRANLVKESVFYSGNRLDVAVIESCQDDLRTTDKIDYYITVGEWELKRNIQVNIICHSKDAQEAGTDLRKAAEEIDKKMRENRTEAQYKAFLLNSEFYANQFSKSKISCSHDYAYSAICASQLLRNNLCEGVFYPSVGYKLKGFNTVYKKELFDNKYFEIVSAYFVKVIFRERDRYPEIKVLNKINVFEEDIIKW